MSILDDPAWKSELAFVVDLMRDISRQKDPQKAATLYSERMQNGPIPFDGFFSLSRRDLPAPQYRITRSSRWKEEVNPWTEKEKLPLFDRGLLSELIYSNQPTVITDLPSRVAPDDPAREYLEGMELLLAVPHFDEGESLNMSVTLRKKSAGFPLERFPAMVWLGNLWGRGTLAMVLRQQLKEAYDEVDRELRAVEEIQRSLLPPELPQIPGLDMAVYYQTSRRAGGDYYDLFPLPDGKWGFFVADVSGHGTPAAVVMAITHAIAHSHPGPPRPPASVLDYINRKLVARYTSRRVAFVTAFYGVYDPHTRVLTFCSAGHNPPRWRRRGRVEPLEGPDGPGGLPLGVEDSLGFTEYAVTLEPGDSLVIYTDGITEAMHSKRGLFGTPRLDALIAEPADSSRQLVERICAEVDRFVDGEPINDDRTLLAITLKN